MPEDALRSPEKLVSDWQQPINRWADLPNSIHNDQLSTDLLVQNLKSDGPYTRLAISRSMTCQKMR